MEYSLGSRLKSAWNAFLNRDPTGYYRASGSSYSIRPDRPRLTRGNERSIVTSVFNRIALDVANLMYVHCMLDEDGRYISDRESGLNDCLSLSANIDQTGRAFVHDVALSLFDEGYIAILPTDTTDNPNHTNSYDILSMRTGKIL